MNIFTFVFVQKALKTAKYWLVNILFVLSFTLLSALNSPFSLAANAAILNSSQLISTVNTVGEAQEEAAGTINEVFGAGTTDKVKGNYNQAAGKTQKNLADVDNQIEGTAKEVKGKVQEDIGTLKNKVEDDIEDTVNFFERIFD